MLEVVLTISQDCVKGRVLIENSTRLRKSFDRVLCISQARLRHFISLQSTCAGFGMYEMK